MNQKKLKLRLKYDPINGNFIWKNGPNKDLFAGWKMLSGYMAVTLNKKTYYLHRLAFLYMTGEIPIQVDHINRKRADNRWQNLRSATNAQNVMNSKLNKRNTSGFKGVTKRNKRFRAALSGRIKGKPFLKHLGYFATAEEAYKAYKKAAKQKYGEYFRG